MRGTLGIDAIACTSGREAVRGADIMVTATSGNTIVFESDWLQPGVLMMSLAPGEFDEQTVLRSRVYLTAVDQVLGDDPPRKPFNTLIASGRFGPNDVAADLSDVVAGKMRGRTGADEIILYESAGLALLDVGIGHWIYHRARSRGLGTEMPFGEH
jgi:ornithine cyclodeaminase/alanine dehydrogenase-like protein (mu-crystallin family)